MKQDLALYNGKITTLNPMQPNATAVGIADGRIVTVGTDDEVRSWASSAGTKRIDLRGRRVIPGLNDSHLHTIRGGLNFNMELRWDGVPSLTDALRELREQAARPHRHNGCESSGAGRSSNSPSAECQLWRRSIWLRRTPPCSCCTCTIEPG